MTDSNGCTATVVVTPALDCEPLLEMSNVLADAPPLMVLGSGLVTFESVPRATAYNAYVDEIGSWLLPTSATGSACGMGSWTDRGESTVEAAFSLPAQSWLIITASNAAGEGPAGAATDGVQRSERGPWTTCGASP